LGSGFFVDVSEAAEFLLFAVSLVDKEPVLIVNNMPPINDGRVRAELEEERRAEARAKQVQISDADDDDISDAEDDGHETHMAGDT